MNEPVPLPIALASAARRLCITEMGVRDLIARGELQPVPDTESLRVDAGQVEQVRLRRQAEALEDCTLRDIDLVGLAERARRALHPVTTTTRRGVDAISAMPKTTRNLFGAAALTAAALDDNGGCRWCFARDLARVWHTAAPQYRPAYIALFGKQAPCEKDKPMLAATAAEQRAQVHGPTVSVSEARSAPAAAPRPAAPPPTAQTAVQRPVRPPVGRAAPAVLRAALVAAGVAPVDRPGRLRCGHRLDAQCGCPRTASARPGAHAHGCGCGCAEHQGLR